MDTPRNLTENEVAGDTLPLGAHLVTPRWGFTHHGIYVGNGRVIHYAGLRRLLRGGLVEEITIERFAKHYGLAIKDTAAALFGGESSVARARRRLGESRYRLFSNNCEHFAEWCTTGVSRSSQVEGLKVGAGWVLRILDWLCGFACDDRAISRRVTSEILGACSEIAR